MKKSNKFISLCCALMAVLILNSGAYATTTSWPVKEVKFSSVFPDKPQYNTSDFNTNINICYAEPQGAKPILWPGVQLESIAMFENPEVVYKSVDIALTLNIPKSDEAFSDLGRLNFDGPADKCMIQFFDQTEPWYVISGASGVEIYVFPYQWFETPEGQSRKVTIFFTLSYNDLKTLLAKDIKSIAPVLILENDYGNDIITANLQFTKAIPALKATLNKMATLLGIK